MNWEMMSARCCDQAPEKSARGRGSERHSCRLRVRYRRVIGVGLYRQHEQYLEGMIRNRSEGGVLVETLQYLPEGQQVELTFKSPDGGTTFMAMGVVRWIRKLSFRLFHVGIQFDSVTRF